MSWVKKLCKWSWLPGFVRVEYTDTFWPTLDVSHARAMLEAPFRC